MQPRINPHVIETKTKDLIRTIVDESGALYREISERDYGIDGLIERFDAGKITGRIAYLQIKGTKNNIVPMKKSPKIACKVSMANLAYSEQNNIPCILLYVSLSEPSIIYYLEMQSIHIDKKQRKQKNLNIHIPQENIIFDKNLEPIFKIIDKYYE